VPTLSHLTWQPLVAHRYDNPQNSNLRRRGPSSFEHYGLSYHDGDASRLCWETGGPCRNWERGCLGRCETSGQLPTHAALAFNHRQAVVFQKQLHQQWSSNPWSSTIR
jgi:hypothetical protein